MSEPAGKTWFERGGAALCDVEKARTLGAHHMLVAPRAQIVDAPGHVDWGRAERLNGVDEDLGVVPVTKRRHLRQGHAEPGLVLDRADRDQPYTALKDALERFEPFVHGALEVLEWDPE